MLVTRETFHFEILALKFVSENTLLMSGTFETSQSSIGPCGLLEHVPLGGVLRHVFTALFSSNFDSGENTGFAVTLFARGGEHTVSNIDPGERLNMDV